MSMTSHGYTMTEMVANILGMDHVGSLRGKVEQIFFFMWHKSPGLKLIFASAPHNPTLEPTKCLSSKTVGTIQGQQAGPLRRAKDCSPIRKAGTGACHNKRTKTLGPGSRAYRDDSERQDAGSLLRDIPGWSLSDGGTNVTTNLSRFSGHSLVTSITLASTIKN